MIPAVHSSTSPKVIKSLIFLACLLPIFLLVWKGVNGTLSANPISDITLETGIWTLRFVVLTLAITPVRKISGWHALIKVRRMLGLFAFFYGLLHFLTYIWLDQFFEWQAIVQDISKRRFITMGLASFVLMIPLAVTSTQKMIRRLGGRRWDLLHRLIYATAIGGIIHYVWLVKVFTYRQTIYLLLLLTLLGLRLMWRYRPHLLRRNIKTEASRTT